MIAPPVFQRAPRIYPEIPGGEVDIPSPSAMPSAPTMSIVMVIAPALLFLATFSFAIYSVLDPSKNSSVAVFSFLASGGMALGVITTATTYFTQRRNYARNKTEREKRYHALLASRREDLTRMREQQWSAMRQVDPDPLELLTRAERLDRRLWERSPVDPDFLSTRIGLGSRPFSVTVKSPRQEAVLEGDSLLDEAQKL